MVINTKERDLIPKEKFIHGESPVKIPNWRLIVSPERPDCVENEEGIEIYTTQDNVKFVRTPEERFENLHSFPYEPHYALIDGLRMHYVDEGSKNGEVILLLHGQPTWSYLYRKMIPILAEADYRVIAADHIGMGRSDKPIDLSFHTNEKHIMRLKKFISALNLKNITLFCQDWGGLMGLRVVGDQPESFARVIAANTQLPIIPKGMNPFLIPNPITIDCSLKNISFKDLAENYLNPDRSKQSITKYMRFFQRWILWCLTKPNFKIGEMLQVATLNHLSNEEIASYESPYPSLIYKAAIRTFPSMIAAVDQNNVEAWKNLGEFEKPFLFLGGEGDTNMGSLENQKRFKDHIPGTKGQSHQRYPNAGHFIQDDIGVELANKIISFMKTNPI